MTLLRYTAGRCEDAVRLGRQHIRGLFLDRWGSEAAVLGWRTEDVFGIHPAAPSARYDAMGLVPLIGGGEVTVIDGIHPTIRRRKGA